MSSKQKKPARRTIKFSELKRLSFCNSSKLPQAVDVKGQRMEWVGIGWINVGPSTGREVKVLDE